MGLLQGQISILHEGDCYNYLMGEFCEDVYFSISAKTAYNGPMTAYSLRHILNSDMIDYLLPVLQKAPEGFLSYLVDNEYVSMCNYRIEDVIDELWQTYDANSKPAVKKRPSSYKYSVYFKWKLKELFHKFDILLAANDTLTMHHVNLTNKY